MIIKKNNRLLKSSDEANVATTCLCSSVVCKYKHFAQRSEC